MSEYQFKVSGAPDLEVRVPAGRVEIVEGPQGEVSVSVDSKDPDFTVEQRGDLISVISPRSAKGWTVRSEHVLIHAPQGSSVDIVTASANVSIRVALRKASVKTASGDVNIDAAESAVVKTASGDGLIGATDAILRFNSASGDLQVRGPSSGVIEANTVSGDIRVDRAEATIEAKTVSGAISVGAYTGPDAQFKTVSGNVTVGLLPGTKLHLDADTRTGRVQLPNKPPVPVEAVREMSIRARLVSGSVTIERV